MLAMTPMSSCWTAKASTGRLCPTWITSSLVYIGELEALRPRPGDPELAFNTEYPPLRRRYWEEKGFWVCTIAQVLNLLALDFTVVISGALLLGVNYSGLQEECLKKDSCDIWTVRL